MLLSTKAGLRSYLCLTDRILSKYKPTNQLVAVKIIDIDAADFRSKGEDTVKDVLRETAALRALKESHARNINLIYDAFFLASYVWIVSQYCPGGSVRTLVSPASQLSVRSGRPLHFLVFSSYIEEFRSVPEIMVLSAHDLLCTPDLPSSTVGKTFSPPWLRPSHPVTLSIILIKCYLSDCLCLILDDGLSFVHSPFSLNVNLLHIFSCQADWLPSLPRKSSG